MRVFRDISTLPRFHAPIVTVGSFDGVHRGHKHLLEVARARACESGGESVVVTFANHPRPILEPQDEVMVLNTLEDKVLLLGKEGVDNLVVLPFDERLREMTAEEFVRDILVGQIGVDQLVVGYNHKLGRDRAGDVNLLRKLGEKYGFRVYEADKLEGEGGEKISSTEIRKALARGDVAEAEKMLGRRLK